MKNQRILVVGASGIVGKEISRLLKVQGMQVRETTGKKENREGKNPNEVVYLNLISGEGIKQAFEGVDRAFILSPSGFANQYEILSPLIQEAKRQGLQKVVLMSAMGANAVETSPLRRAELELEKSGLTYNIIRPNWFMQNFNSFWIQGIREHGKILLPAGKASVSFIDTRDIAAVAAELLISDKLKNQAFDLTGPEALDHDQVAEALSKAALRNVTYQEISPELLKAGLLAAGFPEDYSNFILMIFEALKAGYSAPTTKNVKLILGREATPMRKYAEDYKAAWQ